MSAGWTSLVTAPYRCLIYFRTWLYERGWFTSRRLPRPVVSVGNLTVGGTGKTPMTMWVAEMLAKQGKRVAILSRGYRRRHRHTCVLVSDGQSVLVGPRVAGDEPYMMARRCPGVVVAVGADRYQLGRWVLRRLPVDCFVLDDGFQHLRVVRDVNLLLVDCSDADGMDALLPVGRLREPLSAATRASEIILTRADDESATARVVERLTAATGVTVRPITTRFVARSLVGDAASPPQPLDAVRGKTALMFSGVGNPRQFRRTVDTLGVRLVGEMMFRDHESYAPSTMKNIARRIARDRPDVALTTEKDLVKVQPHWTMDVPVLAVSLAVEFVDGRSRLEEALANM